MLKKLFISILFILTTPIFATPSQPIFTSPHDKIVVSEKNPTFTITLQSNPTTGFSWKVVKYDTPLFTLMSHHFTAPTQKNKVGAPGYETWTFEAKKGNYRVAQVGHIVLEYARPWTKEQATQTVFTVVVSKG